MDVLLIIGVFYLSRSLIDLVSPSKYIALNLYGILLSAFYGIIGFVLPIDMIQILIGGFTVELLESIKIRNELPETFFKVFAVHHIVSLVLISLLSTMSIETMIPIMIWISSSMTTHMAKICKRMGASSRLSIYLFYLQRLWRLGALLYMLTIECVFNCVIFILMHCLMEGIVVGSYRLKLS